MNVWKKLRQTISLTLVAAMLTQLPVVANAMPNQDDHNIIGPVVEAQNEPEAKIITELPDERSEYNKYFLLDNGSRLAVQYASPVHYQDDSGEWQQYDNRMEETTNILDAEAQSDELQTCSSNSADTTEYKVKQSDKDIRLSKKAGSKKLVTVSKDGYKISWGFTGAAKAPVEFSAPEAAGEGNDAFLNLPGVMHEAWYRDVFPDVDLQYLITPTGVKENIVLKSAGAQTEFELSYQFNGLNAIQTDGKTIALKSATGETVYEITAPMMQDTNGEWSNALSLSIISQKKNKLTVKISADSDWLQASERVFPVTVDPSFVTNQAWGTVDSTTLVSGHPGTAYGQGSSSYIGSLYVGYETNSGFAKTRALLKLNTLPQLSPGDIVVNAKLALLQYASSSAIQVNAHKVTGGWNMATATWNSASGGYDPIVTDYTTTTAGVSTNYNIWDITSIARGWYDGEANNGVMLIAPTENSSSMSRVIYYASTYPSSVVVRPVFQITYRSNRGLESYWTYHEQSLSNGSTGHINDYSGNLVYQAPLMSESGSRLPISVNLTYNGYISDQQFLNGSSGLVMGNGWQMNLGQRCWKVENLPGLSAEVIAALQAAGYKRIYIDEDGTVHYFKTTTNDNTLEDEDGLGMTMKINSNPSSPYLIECADGSKIHFTAYGYLYKFEDANGNTATVDYNGVNLAKITDGAGRVTTFSTVASGGMQRLTKVTDPSGRETSLTYDGNNLQKITYPDGTNVQFAYSPVSANGKTYYRISRVTDKDGTYLTYGYKTTGLAQELTKVSSVQEFAADGTAGNSMTVDYNRDNTTKFTYQKSGVATEETYSFDNFGRTVCILNADGSATTGAYTSDPGKTNNRLTQAAEGAKYVNNLLLDTSAEKSSSQWILGGTPNIEATRDSTQHYLGGYSLKIAQNSAANKSNCQSVSVSSNKTYTFSAYMKTDDVAASGENGACLWVLFYNGGGAIIGNKYMKGVTGTVDWRREKLTFTTPSGTTTAEVHCGLRSATGTVWYDCLQLESGDTMNDYNMIESSSFERLGSWTGQTLGTGDGTNTTQQRFNLTGAYGKNRSGFQTIQVNRSYTSFTMSAKAQGSSVPVGYEGRFFALDLGVYYADGTTSWHVAQFNPDTSGVQYLNSTISIPEDKKDLKINYVVFYMIYYYNANSAWFDDCMLTFDETGTAYTHDSKGNVISAKDNAGRNSAYSYNNADELTKYTDEKNESYSYIYAASNEHRLTAARSNQLGNGFVFTYDAYGNVTGTQMGTVSADGTLSTASPYMQSGTTYNDTGNYVTAITDPRGNTTNYSVNDATGLINSVTDANGNMTSYTYESGSLLPLTVTGGGITNGYTYDAFKRLSSILHNGTTYHINYDKFGNTGSVQVGNQTLVTNNYAANNGNLTSAVYGNGTTFGYTYDRYDRVTGVSINGSQKYTTLYNSKGQVAETNDLVNGHKTEYTYDISGRLLRAYQPGYSDISSAYDVMNRVTGTRYSFAGQTKSVSYGYGKDGLKGSSTLLSGTAHSTNYDTLNRETSMTLGGLSRTISYLNVDSARTTTLPASLSWTQNGTSLFGATYTYDAVGNITAMTADGTTYTYTYDSLNQLKSVSDGTNTISYSYDNGGNITSKTINGTTITYSYGDTNWTDKLTGYNGQTITYDAIGNPLGYRDGMTFSWTGRRMDSAMVNGVASNYLYSANGIRTRKTVGSAVTEYFLSGSVILAEKTGSDVIWYIYDSDGDLLGFTYNGTPYYYLKNQQGDVYKVVDADGGVVASYAYDAWGKVLSSSGPMADINPIRYRSYYYDHETGMYYLQSRYYDPETGRFINADGILGANQDLLSYNLFAYCSNNPINYADPTGAVVAGFIAASLILLTATSALGIAVLGAAGAQTAQKQMTGNLQRAWNNHMEMVKDAIGYPSAGSSAKASEQEKDKAIPKQPKKQAFFTVNPYDFNPKGLVMREFSGTYNGRIIEWRDPISKAKIFEWNEDFRYGPHYHAMMIGWGEDHMDIHYLPDTPVPEPWNSLYFGG